MSIFQTIVIAIVEGLTEFLPVSSTGHMIITQALLGVDSTAFVKAFTVNIQFGAILSVVVLYWKRFFKMNKLPENYAQNKIGLKRTWSVFSFRFDFYVKLFVAFLPAAVIGFLAGDYIDLQQDRAHTYCKQHNRLSIVNACFGRAFMGKTTIETLILAVGDCEQRQYGQGCQLYADRCK